MPSAWGQKPRGPLDLQLQVFLLEECFFHLFSYSASFPFSLCSWNSRYFIIFASFAPLCLSAFSFDFFSSLYFLYLFYLEHVCCIFRL